MATTRVGLLEHVIRCAARRVPPMHGDERRSVEALPEFVQVQARIVVRTVESARSDQQLQEQRGHELTPRHGRRRIFDLPAGCKSGPEKRLRQVGRRPDNPAMSLTSSVSTAWAVALLQSMVRSGCSGISLGSLVNGV